MVDKVICEAKKERITARPPGMLMRSLSRLAHLIALAGFSREGFTLLCLAFGAIGFMAGLFFFTDPGVAVVAALSAVFIPFIYALVRSRSRSQIENEELEALMSSVTHAYLGSSNIIASFESYTNMRNKGLDPRLRQIGPVEEFLLEIHSIDPSVENGLRKMQLKYHNRFFDDWVNMLILCQSNRDLKFTLQPIIKSFNDSKLMQVDAEVAMRLIWIEYLTLVGICLTFTVALRWFYDVWFNILIYTLLGRVFLSLLLLSIVLTSLYMLRVTRPLD